ACGANRHRRVEGTGDHRVFASESGAYGVHGWNSNRALQRSVAAVHGDSVWRQLELSARTAAQAGIAVGERAEGDGRRGLAATRFVPNAAVQPARGVCADVAGKSDFGIG